jgi:hypothetical protein
MEHRSTNECVTIKCNKCGKVWVFYPATVRHHPECDCGNTDSGNSLLDWPHNRFGNFTLVSRGMETLSWREDCGRGDCILG